MNRRIPNIEYMDAYLKNKLGPEEKNAFEQQISQDPLLQGEINLQQQIVRSLAEVRKAELKARLNAIPVDSFPFWYSVGPLKWFAGTLATVSLGLIAYFYLPDIYGSDVQVEPIVQLDKPEQPLKKEALLPVPEPTPTPTTRLSEEKKLDLKGSERVTNKGSRVVLRKERKSTTSLSKKTETPIIPNIIKPEVINEFDDSFQNREFDDIDIPNKDLSDVNKNSIAKVEIQNILDSPYDFHYQYYDNKLYLYGDFKDIPYEILALNNANGTRLFLSYNDRFYMINKNQREAIPLAPIENQQLVKELKIISNYK